MSASLSPAKYLPEPDLDPALCLYLSLLTGLGEISGSHWLLLLSIK